MIRKKDKVSLLQFTTLYGLFSAVLFLSFSVEASDKKDILERFRKPMPEIGVIEDEEFRKQTKPIRKRPYGQDVLEYTIRIPKNWTQKDDHGSSNFLLSEKLFLDLNTFYGPATSFGRSRLEIQALNLDSNLTAEQWYLQYLLDGGLTTEGFVVHDEKNVESLMVHSEMDISFYVRSRYILNGNKIITARYFVPVASIKAEAPMQAQVLESLKMENLLERTADPTKVYRFLDVAEVEHPDTWEVVALPLRSVDRLGATLLNVKKVAATYGRKASKATEAKVDITIVAASPSTTLLDEVEKYKKKIELSGMLVGEKLEEDYIFEYDDRIDFGITEVYLGTDSANNQTEYEFWFTVMVGGNYYYFMMMLTSSRNERFALWAENTQAYKLLVSSFTPLPGAFLERN